MALKIAHRRRLGRYPLRPRDCFGMRDRALDRSKKKGRQTAGPCHFQESAIGDPCFGDLPVLVVPFCPVHADTTGQAVRDDVVGRQGNEHVVVMMIRSNRVRASVLQRNRRNNLEQFLALRVDHPQRGTFGVIAGCGVIAVIAGVEPYLVAAPDASARTCERALFEFTCAEWSTFHPRTASPAGRGTRGPRRGSARGCARSSRARPRRRGRGTCRSLHRSESRR